MSLRITEEDEKVLQEINRDISHHKQAIVVLNRRLNSFILINRLPPELLAKIFLFCRDGPLKTNQFDHPKFGRLPSSLRWVLILGVCHHWREVALQTPRLWARVDLDHPKFVESFPLGLAKSCPLHLKATRWSAEQSTLFNTVISNMNNVQTIDFDLAQLYRATGTLDVFPPHTSQLKSIRVVGGHQAVPTFLSAFEKCNFPALQILVAQNCIGSLPPCLLSSTLKHLTIQTSGQFINPGMLIQALSQMDQLQSLNVEGVSFRQAGNPQPASASLLTQKIPLPSLRRLILQPSHGGQRDYMAFLAKVELSSHQQVQLKFHHAMPDEDVTLLLRVVLAHFGSFTFRSIALSDVGNAFIVGLWQRAIDPSLFDTMMPNPPFALWLPSALQVERVVWDDFLHLLPLQNVETIHLGELIYRKKLLDDWRRLLQTCLRVKSLGMMGDVALKMVRLLRETQAVRTNKGEKVVQPVAPKLVSIHLTDVVWRTLDEVETDDSGKFIRDLMHLLKIRGIALLPIKKLVIKRCLNMDPMHVNLFRAQGRTVEWDNRVSYEEDDEEDDEDYDSDDPYGLNYHGYPHAYHHHWF